MATRLTREQRLRSNIAAVLVLALGAAAWSLGGGLASWITGHGWHPAYAHPDPAGIGAALRADPGASFFAVHPSPAPTIAWVLCAAAIAVLGLRLVIAPLLHRPDPRAAGLATWAQLRGKVSRRALRRAGRFTRPDLTASQRWLPFHRVPLTDLGYHLGTLRGTRHELWADFEKRVRVIARTGWGKSARLLVPIARTVPGAALIGSTAMDLFEQVVQHRLDRGHRVLVVDFSDPSSRYAAGYERLTWNPVAGCRDITVALRRAKGLVSGTEDGDRNDAQDGFFRDAAMHVIAAWLHAADLGRLTMNDVLTWQRNTTLTAPHDIIDRHGSAQQSARLALLKHLDARAERTTSGVERFVASALYPFATDDGAEFAITDHGVDVEQLIKDQATVFLLASPSTAASVSPLLTLFADEWLHACRSVALSLPGRRLPVPAVAVLDELRGLVPVPSLPTVAYEYRKYGVGLVYSVQNGHQEVELYGPAAESLAQNVQVTIVGGYDPSIADEITKQAGRVRVASVSVSGALTDFAEYSEGGDWRETIDAADQQQLDDGESVIRLAGSPLFYAFTRSFRDNRALRRQIKREEARVRATVAAGQARLASETAAADQLAQAEYEAHR